MDGGNRPLQHWPFRDVSGHAQRVQSPTTVEIYALRSPLSPSQASERLRQLGSAQRLPSTHQQVIELELHMGEELLGAGISFQIESRSRGSYITARIAENRFLIDFIHVVRGVLALYAVAIIAYVAFALEGPARVWGLLGVAGGLVLFLSLLSFGLRLAERRLDLEIPRTRLRHQLASLLCR